jgi:hypothetical protein
MSNIYEKYGVVVDQLEETRNLLSQLFTVVRYMKEGKLALREITLTDNGWTVDPKAIERIQKKSESNESGD